jgi:TPR repeat protein
MRIILVICMIVVSHASEFTAMQEACDNKIATACYEFAFLYETGVWVKKDPNKAKEHYTKSCEYGYDKACEILDKSK